MRLSQRARASVGVSVVAAATGAVLGFNAQGDVRVDGPTLPRPGATTQDDVLLALGGPPDEEVDPDLVPPPDAGAALAPPPTPSGGHPSSPVAIKDGMVRIPAGSLRYAASRGLPPVAIPSFWIDRTEVTVDAYRACAGAGACPRPARTSATCTYDLGEANLPISCVHWADADAFCRFAAKRLPTEAEWERAARGAVTFAYPWGGTTSCAYANTMTGVFISVRPCSKHPSPVGTHAFGASPFGVQDVVGNVEEWTADWYREGVGTYGPAPRAGSAHVLRGGGWLSTPAMSYLSARDWASSMEAGPNVGFRCARSDDR